MADASELVVGALIAGLVGLFTTEVRWWRERRARRRLLASGLLIDLKRTLRVLDSIPLDTPVHAVEGFFNMIGDEPPRKSGYLYLKNGLFQTHYAQIMELGPEIAEQMLDLYDNIYSLEFIAENYAMNKEITEPDPRDKMPEVIYNSIICIKKNINYMIPALEATRKNKRIIWVD